MPKRAILALKLLAHLLCLAPFALLLYRFQHDDLGPDPVHTITHFTGNWALYLLLASLAITPLRRLSSSIAFLIRFRRLVGLYAFFYASLHLATYVFLFSGYDLPSVLLAIRAGNPGAILQQWHLVWPTIAGDLLKRRFIQVGIFSWLLLLALACTSPAVIMRVIGGKNWQRLHRLVYLAAIAAVIHFWWLVKPGVRTPWKDTAALALLLAARLAYTALKKARTKPSASRPVPQTERAGA